MQLDFLDCFVALAFARAPRNDESRDSAFWQKQNKAKTLIRIFDLILLLDSCKSTNHNRSNGGVAFVFVENFGIKLD